MYEIAAAELLETALQRMDNGRNWIKYNAFGTKKGKLAYCPYGAVVSASEHLRTEYEFNVASKTKKRAVEALAEQIDPEAPISSAMHTLIDYNDSVVRRWPQIQRIFEKAIYQLRNN